MELHRLRLSEPPRGLDITTDGGGINQTPRMKGYTIRAALSSRCALTRFRGYIYGFSESPIFFRTSYFGVVSREPNVSGINRDALVCANVLFSAVEK